MCNIDLLLLYKNHKKKKNIENNRSHVQFIIKIIINLGINENDKKQNGSQNDEYS